MKMLIGKDSDEILGFTAFGVEASELMAAVQTAMVGRMPYTRHCHAASGLRSRWWFCSQGDEENQLSRLPLSARDHPAGDLALSPVHTKPT
jgi:hypothetical protein